MIPKGAKIAGAGGGRVKSEDNSKGIQFKLSSDRDMIEARVWATILCPITIYFKII